MADAISVLKEQHVEVEGLFMKAQRAKDAGLVKNIFRLIDAYLRIHSELEEKIFYPEFKKAAVREPERYEVEEYERAHHHVTTMIEELEGMSTSDPSFKGKLQSLAEAVKAHAEDEEHRMFKQAQKIFSTRQLDDMGLRMEHMAGHASPVYSMSGVER